MSARSPIVIKRKLRRAKRRSAYRARITPAVTALHSIGSAERQPDPAGEHAAVSDVMRRWGRALA